MSAVESNPNPPKPKGRPKTLNCPNCGGSVTLKAPGHSISAVCSYCSSVIDVANENFRLLLTAHEKTRPTLLEIGAKGKLLGKLWEVIGYMEKTDDSGIYSWDEYLLYNPYYGFKFLVQTNGHWSLVTVLKKDVAGAGQRFDLHVDGRKYSVFLKGGAKVAYVKGEFYWRAEVGERVKVMDYIAPPYFVSVEQNEEEINIALGEYLSPKLIEEAFKPSRAMPYQTGVAANQPNPYQSGKVWTVTFLALAVATVLQLMSSCSVENATVLESAFEIQAMDKDKTFSSESFVLPAQTNVEIETFSPVQNDWLELDYSLVNEKNAEFSAGQVIEYYSGSDSDGAWSEGAQQSDSFMSGLDGGTYRLLFDADAGAFQKGQPVSFSVKIKRDVPVWSNYGLTVLLLLLYPFYAYYRSSSFEGKRWAESDLADNYHFTEDQA